MHISALDDCCCIASLPGPGFSFARLRHAALHHTSSGTDHDLVRNESEIRPGGFGLVLIRAIADELVYNEQQNEVVFVNIGHRS